MRHCNRFMISSGGVGLAGCAVTAPLLLSHSLAGCRCKVSVVPRMGAVVLADCFITHHNAHYISDTGQTQYRYRMQHQHHRWCMSTIAAATSLLQPSSSAAAIIFVIVAVHTLAAAATSLLPPSSAAAVIIVISIQFNRCCCYFTVANYHPLSPSSVIIIIAALPWSLPLPLTALISSLVQLPSTPVIVVIISSCQLLLLPLHCCAVTICRCYHHCHCCDYTLPLLLLRCCPQHPPLLSSLSSMS